MCNCANCRAQQAETAYESSYAYENAYESSYEMATPSSLKGQTLLDEILNQESESLNSNSRQSLQYDIIGPTIDWKKITKTTEAPFRYICQISITFPNGNIGFGSGTLIGPRTVLTAAHVIWNHDTNKLIDLNTIKISVAPGRNEQARPLGSVKATKLITAAGYNNSKGTSSLDYGIIHLAEPIGERVGYWSFNYKKSKVDPTGTSILKGTLPKNLGKQELNVAGYPYAPELNASGYKLLSSFGMSATLENGVLRYTNDTKGGHSGSPVWVRRHSSMGGRVLVGIHTGCRGCSVTNKATYIDTNVRNFILANTL